MTKHTFFCVFFFGGGRGGRGMKVILGNREHKNTLSFYFGEHENKSIHFMEKMEQVPSGRASILSHSNLYCAWHSMLHSPFSLILAQSLNVSS